MKYRFLYLIPGILFINCSGFIAKEPRVSLLEANVLLPQVHFITETEDEVYIEYWPELKPNKVQVSKISKGKVHDITLVNLTQLTNYLFTIRRTDQTRKSKTYSMITGSVPELVFRPEKVKIDTTLFHGYILVRRLAGFGADAILNNEGEIVWYYMYDKNVRRAFSWTNHQTVLSTYDSAEIVEVDLQGNELVNMNLEKLGITNKLHHEIKYNDKGEIAVLTLDSAREDLRKFGGTRNQMLRADGIVVISKEGKKIWDWNILQQVNPQVFDGGPFKLNESWGHANSFEFDKDGNYIISFRDFNQVWKINARDGSIIWKLGKNGDFVMDDDSYFIHQHSVHVNKKGELMMFDNGSASERLLSRVLCFKVDEKSHTATTTVKVDLPLDLSLFRMCSADYIADGKYLVCATRPAGPVAVVNDAGEILWRVNLMTPSYRAYYLENPFRTDPL